MTIRSDSSTARVTTTPMVGRATAEPADRRFRAALADGATVLLGGVESAARSLPGGEIVAAAIDRTSSAAGSRSSAGAAGGGSISALVSGGATASAAEESLMGSSNDAMELIALQQQMQDENRRYSTLSNVLKARHETAKNAIGNIR